MKSYLGIATLITVLLFAFMGCSSSKKKNDNKNDQTNLEQKSQNLTEAQAMARSKVLSNIEYRLHVYLDKESNEFKGQEQIEFDLSQVPTQLHLDFRGGRIAQYSVNNKDIEKIEHADGVLKIPTNLLKKGSNHVVLHYAQNYSKDGRGLYKFKDTEDGRVYLWTQFEPFDANQFIPSFDQPDLKATLQLTVTAPADWTVITTTLENKVQTQGGPSSNMKTWFFPETPKISTYLYSLHAGPYKMWKSQAGKVPLRLFVRQTMAKYVRPDFWFTISKQGFQFFDNYFAYPYPFKKYDQLIVPDFNGGAMENVAAVTFSERYLIRGEETRKNRENLGNVILHEMAHMWFGNLVTMKWWDGLWLNESFATYMAYTAMVKATEFKESWIDLQNKDKQWAYEEDQRVTTHAINGKVPDIESTFMNFDAITYGKGAASLKQLAFYIGDDNFRDGLRAYFKKYEYQNTILEDFIGSLAQASGKDLNDWADQWLEKKGLDSVSVQFQCKEEGGQQKITQASLEMTPSKAQSALRIHATQVGLFDKANNQLVQRKVIRAEYGKGTTELISLIGEKCPDFVYPNVEDYDYVKVVLDKRSFETVKNDLSEIKDSFTRQMVWNNLIEMLEDRKITSAEYLNLILKNLPKEKDPQAVGYIVQNLPQVAYYLPKATEEQKAFRLKAIGQLEELCWNGFLKARRGTDEQKIWFDTLVWISETPEMLTKLANMLKGRVQINGFVLDQDRRWQVVIRLMSFANEDAEALLAREKKKDSSETGLKYALAAQVARPNAQLKFELLQKIIATDSDMPFARKRVVARYAFPINQDELRELYRNEFYKNLLQMVKDGRDSQTLRLYTGMVPMTCDQQSLKQISTFLDKNSSILVPSVLKPLRISKQEEERCIEIRKIGMNDTTAQLDK